MGKSRWAGERHVHWMPFSLLTPPSLFIYLFIFCEPIFCRGSIIEGIPLGYCSFPCILFWKEGAFCLGEREMKRISFREAVLVPNFCIVKAQN